MKILFRTSHVCGGVSMIGEPVIGYTDEDFSAYIRQLFVQDDISAFYNDER
jgi:hypothetical protein